MPQLGARVLLLDPYDRVLLILSTDPAEPWRRWWDLPGGKVKLDETLVDTACRELREEAGVEPDSIERHLWDREVEFRYRGVLHHRRDSVFLARVDNIAPSHLPAHTDNERLNLIEPRWWSVDQMSASAEWFLPANLPSLVADVISGALDAPLFLDY